MSSIKQFEDLEIWVKARIQAKAISTIIQNGNFKNDFSAIKQILTASASVMHNIAEGFGRGGNREFVNFLSISRGSNDETRSELYVAFDRNYLDEATFTSLIEENKMLSNKISNFINYLNKSEIKGQKFNR
ncbi:MAG: four helix bundle protein [Saprospiraceae bacterium]